MSEFKVGDKVVFQNSKSDHTEIYTVEAVLDGGRFLGINDYRQAFSSIKFRHAEPQEKAVGHRIDMPSLPKPIGSLQELHPEFAKVLHENFLELLGDESNTVQVAKDAIEHGNDLAMVSIEGVEHVSIAQVIKPLPCEEFGDDSHIENHISPNCKVEDV